MKVWQYWEGPCPLWAQLCHQSVLRHAEEYVLLTPDAWEKLWQHDRDIDLSRLHIAHKADYIRCYLLLHHGGLWVDSDTVAVKPLAPVLDLAEEHGFVANRDHMGYVGAGFLAAPPGNMVIAMWYDMLVAVLRAGGPTRWTQTNSEPLTTLCNHHAITWHCLPTEAVNPIRWDQPWEYYSQAGYEQHARRFDERAIVYQFASQLAQRYERTVPGSNLLHPRSFFCYLLSRAGVDIP